MCSALATSVVACGTFVAARALDIKLIAKNAVLRFPPLTSTLFFTNIPRSAKAQAWPSPQGVSQELDLRLSTLREFRIAKQRQYVCCLFGHEVPGAGRKVILKRCCYVIDSLR